MSGQFLYLLQRKKNKEKIPLGVYYKLRPHYEPDTDNDLDLEIDDTTVRPTKKARTVDWDYHHWNCLRYINQYELNTNDTDDTEDFEPSVEYKFVDTLPRIQYKLEDGRVPEPVWCTQCTLSKVFTEVTYEWERDYSLYHYKYTPGKPLRDPVVRAQRWVANEVVIDKPLQYVGGLHTFIKGANCYSVKVLGSTYISRKYKTVGFSDATYYSCGYTKKPKLRPANEKYVVNITYAWTDLNEVEEDIPGRPILYYVNRTNKKIPREAKFFSPLPEIIDPPHILKNNAKYWRIVYTTCWDQIWDSGNNYHEINEDFQWFPRYSPNIHNYKYLQGYFRNRRRPNNVQEVFLEPVVIDPVKRRQAFYREFYIWFLREEGSDYLETFEELKKWITLEPGESLEEYFSHVAPHMCF